MEVEEREYSELLKSIRVKYGYDFTDYAEASVKRRLINFMERRQISSIDDLTVMVMSDAEVFEEFVQHLSITVTEMFRDPAFYRALRELVVPQLDSYPVIKIWIAGCATGQEVYSIAIVLKEEGLLERSIIYATDINQHSLHVARKGIYSLMDMKSYTHNYIQSGGKEEFSQYYTAKHGGALFDHGLTEKVVYSPHNLAVDGSFNEFQLIICRNVLMYFNHTLQDRVTRLFYESLCPFGYLGLGDKESLHFATLKDFFQEIIRKDKIYRKIK